MAYTKAHFQQCVSVYARVDPDSLCWSSACGNEKVYILTFKASSVRKTLGLNKLVDNQLLCDLEFTFVVFKGQT